MHHLRPIHIQSCSTDLSAVKFCPSHSGANPFDDQTSFKFANGSDGPEGNFAFNILQYSECLPMKLFRRQWHSGKLWAYMITLAYLAGAILYRPRLTGRELVLGAIICPLFLMLYLIPISVFGARVELSEAGLRVQQYGETTIPYSDVLRCYSAFVGYGTRR